jgi:hypothetical protein
MILFGVGVVSEFQALKGILDLFCVAIGMQINMVKSNMVVSEIWVGVIEQSHVILPFARKSNDDGNKYLGLELKPNAYHYDDWLWLVKKIQVRIALWVHRWLSRGGRLVLFNSILSSIPVYWASVAKIPKGILSKIRKMCFHFLWLGHKEAGGVTLVKWSRLAMPKEMGGYGIKKHILVLHFFNNKEFTNVDTQ